ncbi:MAG TPA: hypothetical protein VF009_02705 [Solirubrobacterales bacterium]
MPISFDSPAGQGDSAKLAEILHCSPGDLEEVLGPYARAAAVEYVEMFLGRKVFTRGSDIREYRLFLLMREVFKRLPTEQEVSDLFQTTETQSRSLIRSVMSKYQYELTDVLSRSMKAALEAAVQDADAGAGGDWHITVSSEYIVEALNRLVAQRDGTLTRIILRKGTASSYVIKPSTRLALREALELEP